MRGRRRTPTDLRLVKGDPGKRAAPKHEPKPAKGVPPMPRRVKADAIAAEKWRELVVLTTLPGACVLTIADGPMLELCCLNWSRACEAYEAGYWNRAEKYERAYERQLSHFGLSPAMRGKVERLGEENPDDAAGAHFQ